MRIKWTSFARRKLTGILNYCFFKYGERITKRFSEKIAKDTSYLMTFPYMGRSEGFMYEGLLVRSIIERHYKIAYCVDEGNQIIYIINIFDCRQDPSKFRIEVV